RASFAVIEKRSSWAGQAGRLGCGPHYCGECHAGNIMELVLIAFCRPSAAACTGAGGVGGLVAGRHYLGATMVPAKAAKAHAKHKHDILCGFDCLAELGLVLDLGLDASRCEDVYHEKQLRQLQQLPDKDKDTDDNNNNNKQVAAWRQRPWDFPGGEHAISLAWEDLERVPPPLAAGLGASITALDLSHNRLRDVEFLCAMPALTSLVLDHNQLSEDVELPRLPRLRLLWLNHNQVRSVQPLVRRLQRQTPRLRHLSLIGNKAAPSPLTGAEPSECARYRLSMVWQLPQLEHLDERRVSGAERARSKHLQLRAIFNSCSRLPSQTKPPTPQPLRRNTCI
ncbi:Leucine-rich melanocyte differentiation-associated protein, partial [Frankliniella fusca]